MEDRQLIRQDQAQVKMKRKKKHQSKQLYGYPAFEFVLLDFSRNRKVQQNSMIYLRVGEQRGLGVSLSRLTTNEQC
ncbi:hypothetical protein PV327_001787 [Microctonus hyperodae]|uniref:Uncharacterized protein n=1 Tax=Microctonus hyperodae TaxID=165561 RepID=A0AA39FED7_MICHY|nr:hypothetical protein PV327_001787 [Microctonus hyperodae]